jgi:hypothetical protein
MDRAQSYVGTYLWKPGATEPILISKILARRRSTSRIKAPTSGEGLAILIKFQVRHCGFTQTARQRY